MTKSNLYLSSIFALFRIYQFVNSSKEITVIENPSCALSDTSESEPLPKPEDDEVFERTSSPASLSPIRSSSVSPGRRPRPPAGLGLGLRATQSLSSRGRSDSRRAKNLLTKVKPANNEEFKIIINCRTTRRISSRFCSRIFLVVRRRTESRPQKDSKFNPVKLCRIFTSRNRSLRVRTGPNPNSCLQTKGTFNPFNLISKYRQP